MFFFISLAHAMTPGHQVQLWHHLVSTPDSCGVVRTWTISTFGMTCPGINPSLSDSLCYGRLNLLCVYPDADADGYNSTEDCDDGDPGVNPGEVEVCMDGVDQDCDGQDECAQEELTFLMQGLGADYASGVPMEVSADLTGDGLPDLVAAAPYGTPTNMGGHYSFVNVWAGPIEEGMSTTPAVILDPTSGVDGLGLSVDVGDLDGDGQADLLAGAWTSSIATYGGSMRVFHGPLASGDETSADLTVEGTGYLGYLGWDAVIVGDITGDGSPDIASGDMPQPAYDGGYYVFNGSDTGTTSTASAAFTVDMDATGSFCRPLGYVGDVNGDGFDDLALGDRSYNDGVVALFFGPRTGSTVFTAADMYYNGDGSADFALNVVSVGDANVDGINDVAVTNGSGTYLLTNFDGADHDVTEALATFSVGGAWLQGNVAWGDFNGDGAGDLATSDSYGAGSVNGIMRVYTGPFAGSYGAEDAARAWIGDGSHAGLGYDLETLGDIDSDGRDDFLTVAVGAAMYGGYPGAFYLGYGSLLP